MKKVISILLSVLLVISLVGCRTMPDRYDSEAGERIPFEELNGEVSGSESSTEEEIPEFSEHDYEYSLELTEESLILKKGDYHLVYFTRHDFFNIQHFNKPNIYSGFLEISKESAAKLANMIVDADIAFRKATDEEMSKYKEDFNNRLITDWLTFSVDWQKIGNRDPQGRASIIVLPDGTVTFCFVFNSPVVDIDDTPEIVMWQWQILLISEPGVLDYETVKSFLE